MFFWGFFFFVFLFFFLQLLSFINFTEAKINKNTKIELHRMKHSKVKSKKN